MTVRGKAWLVLRIDREDGRVVDAFIASERWAALTLDHRWAYADAYEMHGDSFAEAKRRLEEHVLPMPQFAWLRRFNP